MPKLLDFEFDLIVYLADGADVQGVVLDRLFEAGCDDALVGLGQPGAIGLSFTRSGESAAKVIFDTIAQVTSALPENARVLKLDT